MTMLGILRGDFKLIGDWASVENLAALEVILDHAETGRACSREDFLTGTARGSSNGFFGLASSVREPLLECGGEEFAGVSDWLLRSARPLVSAFRLETDGCF